MDCELWEQRRGPACGCALHRLISVLPTCGCALRRLFKVGPACGCALHLLPKRAPAAAGAPWLHGHHRLHAHLLSSLPPASAGALPTPRGDPRGGSTHLRWVAVHISGGWARSCRKLLKRMKSSFGGEAVVGCGGWAGGSEGLRKAAGAEWVLSGMRQRVSCSARHQQPPPASRSCQCPAAGAHPALPPHPTPTHTPTHTRADHHVKSAGGKGTEGGGGDKGIVVVGASVIPLTLAQRAEMGAHPVGCCQGSCQGGSLTGCCAFRALGRAARAQFAAREVHCASGVLCVCRAYCPCWSIPVCLLHTSADPNRRPHQLKWELEGEVADVAREWLQHTLSHSLCCRQQTCRGGAGGRAS